eukprot:scaffold45268_cov18-Tisochrysis_lutea.AAC.1
MPVLKQLQAGLRINFNKLCALAVHTDQPFMKSRHSCAQAAASWPTWIRRSATIRSFKWDAFAPSRQMHLDFANLGFKREAIRQTHDCLAKAHLYAEYMGNMVLKEKRAMGCAFAVLSVKYAAFEDDDRVYLVQEYASG